MTEIAEDGVRRRDFITIAATGTAGVGAASVLVPLVSQMAPSADVLAESTTELDVSAIEPGQSIKAVFRKQPLFVKRLTAAEIQEAKDGDTADLRDPQTYAERVKGRLQRLFLPLPRFALRCGWPHSQRAGADQYGSAGIRFHFRHRHSSRLSRQEKRSNDELCLGKTLRTAKRRWLSNAAQPQLHVEFRLAGRFLPRASDCHRRCAGHALCGEHRRGFRSG